MYFIEQVSSYLLKRIKSRWLGISTDVQSVNRIGGVDNTRGIACLMVVFYHFGAKFYGSNSILYLGGYGVHMFFVLSGFVIIISLEGIKKKATNAFQFIFRRVTRLDPPYIITIFIILIYAYLSPIYIHPGATEFSLELSRLLYHFAYLIPFTDYLWYSPVFWTLSIEFQFYLIVALLLFIPSRFTFDLFLVVLVVISIMGFYPPFDSEYFIFRYAEFFLTGVITAGLYLKGISKSKYILILTLSFLANFYKAGWVGVFIVIVTLALVYFFNSKETIFNFLGKISYSLYLLHYFIMHILFKIYEIVLYTVLSLEIAFFISVLITVLFSYVFYLVVERPSIAFSKRIKFH